MQDTVWGEIGTQFWKISIENILRIENWECSFLSYWHKLRNVKLLQRKESTCSYQLKKSHPPPALSPFQQSLKPASPILSVPPFQRLNLHFSVPITNSTVYLLALFKGNTYTGCFSYSCHTAITCLPKSWIEKYDF